MQSLFRGFEDFRSGKVLSLSILPLLFSGVVLFALLKFGLFEFASALNEGEFTGILSVLNFSFVRSLVLGLANLLGWYLVIVCSVALGGVVTGFLTPFVVRYINAKRYRISLDGDVSLIAVGVSMLGVLWRFLLVFAVSLVLLFVPFLNIFALSLPFVYLFHKLMLIDLASCCFDENGFENAVKNGVGNRFRIFSVLFYLISLVPFVGVLAQLFFVSVYANLLLDTLSRKNA